jgi:hypothetical protein
MSATLPADEPSNLPRRCRSSSVRTSAPSGARILPQQLPMTIALDWTNQGWDLGQRAC